jgi:hypothetical protein
MSKKKRCKECEKMGDDCKCPKKNKGGRYGWFGFDNDTTQDSDDHGNESGGDGGGGMGEGVNTPVAPSETDKSMKDMSSEKKKKNLDSFRAAADDAKKRQKYKDENDELAVTRMKKGVRFYDAKGSGYIKGGKKTYD